MGDHLGLTTDGGGFRGIGTWRLAEYKAIDEDDEVAGYPLGRLFTGILIYTPDGHVAVQLHGSGDQDQAPDDGGQGQRVYEDGFVAYVGRYRVVGDSVVHHVETSNMSAWIGTELVRTADLTDGKLTLTSGPVGGWDRVVATWYPALHQEHDDD